MAALESRPVLLSFAPPAQPDFEPLTAPALPPKPSGISKKKRTPRAPSRAATISHPAPPPAALGDLGLTLPRLRVVAPRLPLPPRELPGAPGPPVPLPAAAAMVPVPMTRIATAALAKRSSHAFPLRSSGFAGTLLAAAIGTPAHARLPRTALVAQMYAQPAHAAQ